MAVCNYRNGSPGSTGTSPTRFSACGPAGPRHSASSSTSDGNPASPIRTPLTVFNADVDGKPGVAILLTYGPDRDWLKNLNAAGGGKMRRHGKTFSVANPQTVSKEQAATHVGGAAHRVFGDCRSSKRCC